MYLSGVIMNLYKFFAFILIPVLALSNPITAHAAPAASEDAFSEAEERKLLPIESNQIENWPAGPAIGAQSAILMEANTGVILYAKNIDERLFPASTTKLMTC
ncbi:MAG: hypothetical protein K2P07_04505, partial [Lachnospiraceae bacterium]|nr:hypothetical protein [Lachnospiraceae bacterium]